VCFAKPSDKVYIPLPPSKGGVLSIPPLMWDFFVYSPFEGGLRGMCFAKPPDKVYIPLPPSKGGVLSIPL